ncbi:hypothetical protein VNO77_28293 [Canavalia gladiata]|uniref:Uncharacterized protein n=1 Tax=Canavalia gladiata TaxID=3824 RepID=A0AAN9KVZ1_CANGL
MLLHREHKSIVFRAFDFEFFNKAPHASQPLAPKNKTNLDSKITRHRACISAVNGPGDFPEPSTRLGPNHITL